MTERTGAEPQDWAHLDLSLGLTRDLLPVVSNPNAVISAQSKMKSLGKTPSVYNRKRQVAGIPDWTKYEATSKDITKWSKEVDYGIALQTREVRALDIDVEEIEITNKIWQTTINVLGDDLPPRRGRAGSGKTLLAFRLHGEMPKRILRLNGGLIEFLANGQQFIAYGTHPSGVKYEWDWNGYADFPEITLEQFEKLWAALVKEFAISESTSSSARKPKSKSASATHDPILNILPIISWGKEGQAYIECPFIADHTMDSGETQTAYFPAGTRGYEQGHFHCLHAHCAEKTDADFLDAYGLRAAEFEDLTAINDNEKKIFNIKTKGGNFPQEVLQAEEALLAANIPYYQRGSSLVRPVVETVNASGGRKTRVAQLFDVDAPYLAHDLCKVATWLKFNASAKKWVRINAPPQIPITLLGEYGNWKFPKITGIITTPTLRPDGSLLHQEGFDTETGLLLTGMPVMPDIPENPTWEDAIAALQLLKNLLAEFPFVDDAARAVALSALITPVVRGAFPVAPMHVIRAPAPASGKSFLLEVVAAIALGQPCPVIAAGRNEEETEKRLSAALMTAQPIISVDNVNGKLGGDFLYQLVERPVVEVRVLGKSQMMKLESRSTIFATGNNIILHGDMTRRVVLCMLDANQENPELRQFKNNPVDRVLQERGRYIAAILTLIRAYIVAGSPGRASSIASFNGWSDMVRSALIWLGEEDPVFTFKLVKAEDPVSQNMVIIFNFMRECIGLNEPRTAADILKIAQRGENSLDESASSKYEEFYEAIFEAIGTPAGRINSKQLGRWLLRHKGRIAGGLKLHGYVDNYGHATKWWVTDEESLI